MHTAIPGQLVPRYIQKQEESKPVIEPVKRVAP